MNIINPCELIDVESFNKQAAEDRIEGRYRYMRISLSPATREESYKLIDKARGDVSIDISCISGPCCKAMGGEFNDKDEARSFIDNIDWKEWDMLTITAPFDILLV